MSLAPTLDPVMARLQHLGIELAPAAGEPRRKFDLAHMRSLLEALSNPERRFPSVLIAGTNGKGSTAATLASILAEAGYKTGLYTSPHLVRVNERIQILPACSAGRPVGLPQNTTIVDATFFEHLAQVEQAAAEQIRRGALPAQPSFFETLTAIAFLAFAAAPIDIAVLEVGMGGRLDATNVVDPLISVITDISLDHTEWLGPTIRDIAREKAGILRQDGVMITLPQHPEANQALGEVAVALNVRGINAADYLPGRHTSLAAENHYSISVDGESLLVHSPLAGQHQQRNISLALAAAFELRNSYGYVIGNSAIERGIAGTAWPGRLELISRTGAHPPVLLDAAHNPAGAWALRAALNLHETAHPELRPHLLFGCMRDKSLLEMAQVLFPIFEHIYLTELASPRSASRAELAAAAESVGAGYTVCIDAATAFNAACSATPPPTLIVAGGSMLLIGALRSILEL